MRARTFLLAPVIAGVALLSAACGDDNSSNDAEPAPGERGAYLTAVHATGVDLGSDDEAVEFGQQICDDLASGKSPEEIKNGIDQTDNAGKRTALVSAATGAFCRDEAGQLIPDLPDRSDLPTLPDFQLPE